MATAEASTETFHANERYRPDQRQRRMARPAGMMDTMDAAVVPLLATLADPSPGAELVRVVTLKGFGLRDGSDGLVLHDAGGDDARVSGRVLGGLADAALLDTTVDARTVVRVPVTDRDADAAGMVCGGTAVLLRSPVADLPVELGGLLASATPVALVCPADGSGADTIVTRRDVAGPPVADDVAEQARAALAGGVSESSTVEVDGVEWLIACAIPSPRAVVVGSGPMAEAIVAQGALLGWEAETIEDTDAVVDFVTGAGPADAVIVLSHDRAVDIPILDASLRSAIGYVGAMGSRGTQTARRNRLTELGHDEAALARIHGPVGLDLASRTPAETAVAIVAEYLANRSGRTPASLGAGSGPINH